MDSPALLVAFAMLAAGALGTVGGLAVAGRQWQLGPGGVEPDPVPVVPTGPSRQPDAAIDGQPEPPSGGDERAAEPAPPAARIPGPRLRKRRAVAASPSRQLRLGAYAHAAAERAARAREEAEAARQEAIRAQAARDEAWRALEAVDELPPPDPPAVSTTAVDPAVTQAAFAAFRRGDLTVEELRRLWGRPEEQDPQASVRESERRQRLALSRAARRAYEQAAANARRAEEDAQVAQVAAKALAVEAEQAALDAAEITTV